MLCCGTGFRDGSAWGGVRVFSVAIDPTELISLHLRIGG